jgi:hypothetical protein
MMNLEEMFTCVNPLTNSQMFIGGWAWAVGVCNGLMLALPALYALTKKKDK